MNEKGKHVQCFDGNFLLAETEVVMKTLLSSLVNGTNCIFTVYEIFVTGKIVVFCQYLYNKRFFSVVEMAIKHSSSYGKMQ